MIEDKLLAKLGWILPSITIILSSAIHLVSGNYRDFPFFISESDYPGLERYVFTIGFCVTGIVLMYLSWRLFEVNKTSARWYWMHLSLFSGIFVGANLAMMSFWDMYDHLTLHITTALNVFYFGLAWCVLTHLAMKDASKKSKNLRYLSISLGFISLVGMTYSINLGLIENPEFINGDWDMEKMQPWINWAAPMEYLLALSFILTLKSFESDILPNEEEE
jgi:hypothetical protein